MRTELRLAPSQHLQRSGTFLTNHQKHQVFHYCVEIKTKNIFKENTPERELIHFIKHRLGLLRYVCLAHMAKEEMGEKHTEILLSKAH